MNKDELKQEIQKVADENNVDLPKGWYNKSDENLQIMLDELNGQEDNVDVEQVTEAKNEVTPLNPFGEELIDYVIPTDPQNPKIKTKFISINGKPIVFPLGKRCKIPKSYFALLMDSQEALSSASKKQKEHNYKEL